jgi:hypothetical protein
MKLRRIRNLGYFLVILIVTIYVAAAVGAAVESIREYYNDNRKTTQHRTVQKMPRTY